MEEWNFFGGLQIVILNESKTRALVYLISDISFVNWTSEWKRGNEGNTESTVQYDQYGTKSKVWMYSKKNDFFAYEPN